MPRKKSALVALALVGVSLVLLFQNCGTSEYGLYGSRAPVPWDCLDELACEPKAENLWVEGDSEYSAFPYYLQDIAGDCNDGGFTANRITYQVWRISGGVETKVGSMGTTSCDAMGRYRFRVSLGATFSKLNTYFVTIKIEGIDDQGAVVENLNYPQRADVDVKLSFL